MLGVGGGRVEKENFTFWKSWPGWPSRASSAGARLTTCATGTTRVVSHSLLTAGFVRRVVFEGRFTLNDDGGAEGRLHSTCAASRCRRERFFRRGILINPSVHAPQFWCLSASRAKKSQILDVLQQLGKRTRSLRLTLSSCISTLGADYQNSFGAKYAGFSVLCRRNSPASVGVSAEVGSNFCGRFTQRCRLMYSILCRLICVSILLGKCVWLSLSPVLSGLRDPGCSWVRGCVSVFAALS